MGQAKQRGTFEERRRAAVAAAILEDKRRIEAVRKRDHELDMLDAERERSMTPGERADRNQRYLYMASSLGALSAWLGPDALTMYLNTAISRHKKKTIPINTTFGRGAHAD